MKNIKQWVKLGIIAAGIAATILVAYLINVPIG